MEAVEGGLVEGGGFHEPSSFELQYAFVYTPKTVLIMGNAGYLGCFNYLASIFLLTLNANTAVPQFGHGEP